MKIKEVLEQLNISDKKADIYLTCLEKGGATAYAIAKKVGLKRPTVYDILNQLQKDGLVYKSIKNGVKYFSPADPNSLIRQIDEKKEKVLSIMPALQNLYDSPKTKPTVRYLEGKEGIKEMYEDVLKSSKKGDELLAYTGEDVAKYLPEFIADFVQRRTKKGVRVRGIMKKTLELMDYYNKNKEQLRDARAVDEKFFPAQNETCIYGDKIAVANYGQEMFAIIIESKEMAKSQKAVFELAWLGAEKVMEN